MDYATQNLIEALDRICKAIEDNSYQVERLNDQVECLSNNFEKCIGEFKGNAWFNVSATVSNN